MTERTRAALVLVPWLGLPLAAAGFAALWGRLPERLAVHFDSAGAPDGWMSRWQFALFAHGVLFFILANFTWRLFGGREPEKFYPRLLFFYAGTLLVLGVFGFVIRQNL